ncbi:hypothetical protein QFW77_05425 [Luteimonas sp. RD2P54]|uniref:RNA polymerase sigma factor 70 region 4 type 2 domain-containing protein n=1 Tax=Luteimonas endophytica TaxID=3042023 RepID=A0ABT6J6I9_9GAMM|nr:hypothetical protein [Luteimonas endophytica]MDH5822430.1 hypothetical protein [Luteimonas endophytica]
MSAFLRGVERRAAVFAHLQGGDAGAGDAALAAAMETFRDTAARTPFGDWPRRFWAQLLAAPPLREAPAAAQWPPQFAALARVGHGPRAALLLRLVAHVSEAEAAAVLGISRPTYRLALRRALPRDDQGQPDAGSWRALGEAAQQAVRQLPPARLAELARMREAVLAGRAYLPTPQRDAVPGAALRPRWLWPALGAVALLTLAALAATFVLPGAGGGSAPPPGIVSEPLPPAEPPAAVYDAEIALLTHPDFELLSADGGDAAARDPAFHAWLAVLLERGGDQDIARPQRDETPADSDQATLEPADAR